jgi:hypothetical protein
VAYFKELSRYLRTGAAQSVWCLTTNWTTGVRSPTEAEDFSSSFCVQTGSGAHPASCTMGGTGSSFPRVKRGRGVMLTTHPHLVARLSMSRSYTSSPPMRLHSFTFYPGICLEGLKNIMKTSDRDSWSQGRDMNPEPPEYEPRALTTRPRRSMPSRQPHEPWSRASTFGREK